MHTTTHHYDPDPTPRHWLLCSGRSLDRIATQHQPLEPRDPDPDAAPQLDLLDRLVAEHFNPIDQLIYMQVLKNGIAATTLAPVCGLTHQRVGQRAQEITRRLRIIVNAPPLPDIDDDDDIDARAVWMYADFRSYSDVMDALGIGDRQAAHRAVERGLLEAPPAVVERVAYRREHWRRGGYKSAKSEIVV